MIDAMLGAVVAWKHQLIPQPAGGAHAELHIPIQKSSCGRVYLCSAGQYQVSESEIRYKHRRAPVQEYARFGSRSIRRVRTNAGADKSYRFPYVAHLLEGDTITWWCLGDRDEILDLLRHVTHLGKYRGTGKGRVADWGILGVEPWEGFPVVHAGRALRQLPLDWPGVDAPSEGFAVLSPPYWDQTKEERCLLPG